MSLDSPFLAESPHPAARWQSRPLLSVVIPTYQRRASLERELNALARQSLPADRYEVIVSIDGSDDATRELVANFQAPYRLRGIWQSNRGRAAACNAGLRAGTGDLLILLDDDLEPTPGTLLAHLQSHPTGSRLGVLGAVPVVVDGSAPSAEYIRAKFDRHLAKLAQPGYAITVRDFYSGNFSIRRDDLFAVGGFDETFRLYGNEDLELFLRLSKSGVRCVYNADALAYQHYAKRFAELALDTIAKGRTAVLLASKHPDAIRDLKLGTYMRVSRKWRFVRAVLLASSDTWPGTPSTVMRSIGWLERHRPALLQLGFDLALDYFYWIGVRSAQAELPCGKGGDSEMCATESRAVTRR
jgi:GT2 family glycosyltransferase